MPNQAVLASESLADREGRVVPRIDMHVESTFSYANLQTTDLDAARSFYTSLFGWSVDEVPMADDRVFAIFKKSGRTTAAAIARPPERRDGGARAMWTPYFTVRHVDQLTEEARRTGATVRSEPFDLGSAARTSVIEDPGGALFGLWEPRDGIGAEVMFEPNTLTWTACASKDVEAARSFYCGLFGWSFREMPMEGGGTYSVFEREGLDRLVAGLGPLPVDGMPPSWLDYFRVASCDDAAAAAHSLGGEVRNGPIDRPQVGRIAIVADPQGATFGIAELDEAALARICGFFGDNAS